LLLRFTNKNIEEEVEMVKDFSYFQLTKIVFGPGHVRNIPSLMEEYENKKLLVVTDKNISSFKFFTETVDSLTSNGFKCVVFDEVEPNPSIETCDKAAALARNGCSAVLSIGGGSVIDTGKSAATLVTNPGSIKDYLLGYEDAPRPIINKPIPHIAATFTPASNAPRATAS
jgi:alcohol dehydrogenase